MPEYASLGKCLVKRTSQKAVCIRIPEEDTDRWIPMSLLSEETAAEIEPGEQVEILVEEWFAIKEGLE